MKSNTQSEKLFGDLPEYPPWFDQASYCSECSQCAEQMAENNVRHHFKAEPKCKSG